MVGGPPCQPFSKSGYWKNGTTLRMKDPRAATIQAYLRVLKETLPNAFILENVPGLTFQNKSEGFSYFLEQLDFLNKECKTHYSVSWKILNAADFGVPQIRKRLFLVGHKKGIQFQFPNETHSDTIGARKLYITTWDAIGDLENDFDSEEHKLTGRWAKLIPSIPEGHNYLWYTNEGGGEAIFKWRSRYWNFLLKLSKNKPSWTIQAQPGPATGPFHWNNRKLTSRELLRLQTFPKDYKIVGNRLSVQRQIGNAVPSGLVEVLGLEIRRQYFGENITKKATLIPKTRKRTFKINKICKSNNNINL